MAAAGFKFRKIKSQPLLGQKLSRARKKLKLSLEEVELKIKVRAKYLEALEEGNYYSLPSNVYVVGFLASYAKFLELDSEEICELYQAERRSYGEPKESLLKNANSKISDKTLVITPKTFIWPAIAVFVLFVVGYIFYQVSGFAAAPKLEIASPSTDLVTSQNEVVFEGSTDSGASLTINGQLITVAEGGHFKESIKLQKGLNTVELDAKNKSKKETKKICIIEVREATAMK
jgi:cytoskeletal protein RodZ